MHVLSVEDIDLMISLATNDKLPSELIRHEKQMDKLISMGIIRPGGGVLALTELGYKTAYGLLGRCLGSNVDGPVRPQATAFAPAITDNEVPGDATAESHEDSSTDTTASAEADSAADSDAAAEPA